MRSQSVDSHEAKTLQKPAKPAKPRENQPENLEKTSETSTFKDFVLTRLAESTSWQIRKFQSARKRKPCKNQRNQQNHRKTSQKTWKKPAKPALLRISSLPGLQNLPIGRSVRCRIVALPFVVPCGARRKDATDGADVSDGRMPGTDVTDAKR